MIDIHTHILPSIDDGAVDLETAVEMCRRAAQDGCTTLVATPHQRHPLWWNDLSDLEDRLTLLREAIDGAIELALGAEVHAHAGLLAEIDSLDVGTLRTLAGSRYLLLEFPHDGIGPEPEGILHELAIAGFVPVLAHLELLPWLALDLDRVERLLELGALVQITGASLLGDFGRGPSETAWRLMQRDLVHFVASDCHDLERRPPGLGETRRLIESQWGADRATSLLEKNPRLVLSNQPLETAAA